MKKNIIQTIIILAAILLSTIVIADTPVIPGDATTTTTPGEDGGEETEDDEIEDIEEESSNSDECKLQERLLTRAESNYQSDLSAATTRYEHCIGCVTYYVSYNNEDVTNCKDFEVSSAVKEACYEQFEKDLDDARTNYNERMTEILEETSACFSLENPGSFLNWVFN